VINMKRRTTNAELIEAQEKHATGWLAVVPASYCTWHLGEFLMYRRNSAVLKLCLKYIEK